MGEWRQEVEIAMQPGVILVLSHVDFGKVGIVDSDICYSSRYSSKRSGNVTDLDPMNWSSRVVVQLHSALSLLYKPFFEENETTAAAVSRHIAAGELYMIIIYCYRM